MGLGSIKIFRNVKNFEKWAGFAVSPDDPLFLSEECFLKDI